MRQQCCQQLAQIPENSRLPAIHGVVEAIFLQQQHKQGAFLQPQKLHQIVQGLFHPQQQYGQGSSIQQQQYILIQGILQPQQLAQLEAIRALALKTIPAMCKVQVPPYY
jgi:hypothetical protein